MREKGQSFLGGAAVLMAAALVVKTIGALFKIPLTQIIGGSGMGYFMTAYGFFNPIYALSVAGFPVAVSKLTAQSLALGRRDEAREILTAALLVFLPVGLLLSAGIFFGANRFVTLIGNPGAGQAVLAIAPAVFFACVSATFRGHFEGMRNMAPTAASQVTEALVKLGAGIFLSLHCVRMGYAQYALDNMVFGVPVESAQQALTVIAPRAAAAAICGVTISTAAGSLYMALRWLATSRGTAASKGNILRLSRQLLRVAFPVCLGALVINLTSVIDLFSVMNRLGAAVSSGLPALIASHPGAGLGNMPETEIPNFLYGSYTGLAVTVFNLIPAMTASLGVSALPMMSALHAKGQRARLRLTVESILRVTAMVAVPAGMGLAVMARPILLLLFTQNPAETAVAAPLLQMLGAAVMFVAVAAPICSMLQAVGKVYTPVGLMLLGGSAKLTVNFLLVASPSINIKGAPVGTLLCYLIFMLGGVSALMRAVQTDINLVGIFAKPLAGGSVCCAVAYGSYRWLFGVSQNRLSVIPAVALGGCCYLGVLLLLRAFDENDLALLSPDSKFAKILAKGHHMR